MNARSMTLRTVLVSALLATTAGLVGMSAATAQQQPAPGADLSVVPPVPTSYTPKKTGWGEPDLRGTWPIDHLNGTPMQRTVEQGTRLFLTDAEYAERMKRIQTLAQRYEKEDEGDKIGQGHWVEMGEVSRRTSLLVAPANGRLPEMTEEGKRRSKLMRSSWRKGQAFDAPTDFDSWDRCITRGLPASMLPMQYNNGIRIFQAPGMVAIQLEMIHEVRIIPTDGRKSSPAAIQNWMGESRGHWEGNTLVVETTHLKAGPSATNIVTTGSPPENDTPISDKAKIVERFTMTGPDTIVYEVTHSDPIVYTAPWTVRLDWKRKDDYGMFEYACHEGNVQLRNYISSSRAERGQKESTQ